MNSHINKLLGNVQIVIHIIDARFPKLTFSQSFIDYLKIREKGVIIVVNKVDLVSFEESERIKSLFDFPVVLFSAMKRWGSRVLKDAIYEMADSMKLEYPINVGLVGYPNVGKSSLISLLVGRTSAKISVTAGFTKGLQKVKLNKKIYLWDSPGVYLDSKDETFLALIGSINPEKMKDKDLAAEMVLEELSVRLGVDVSVEDYALKRNFLKKGGLPDELRASTDILRRWSAGTLEKDLKNLLSQSK